MKKFILLVLLICITFIFSGCSGGGLLNGASGDGGGTSSRDNTANMTLTVNWPATGKDSVLSSAYSLKVNVCTPTTTESTTKYRREVNATLMFRGSSSTSLSETKVISGIPVGVRTVIVQAYDDSGAQIGYGTRTVTINQGSNSSVTISLSGGTFSYTFFGMSDVTVPTSGTVTTMSVSYLFVNNYADNSISVIRETRTLDTNIYSAEVVGTIMGVSKPKKGAFDAQGNYYVTGDSGGYAKLYKVVPNTSNWSASAVSTLYTSTEMYPSFQEIVYNNGYLYVGLRYYLDPTYRITLLKINPATGNVESYSTRQAFSDGHDYNIVGLYSASTGKIIVACTQDNNQLYLKVAYDDGHSIPFLITDGVRQSSMGVSAPIGIGPDTFYLSGVAMPDSSSVLVPGGGTVFRYALSGTGLSYSNQTPLSDPQFKKVLEYGGTAYAFTNNFGGFARIYYGVLNADLSTMQDHHTYFGWSISDFADMALSKDKNRIYLTDFGLNAFVGNQVFVMTAGETVENTSTQITVGRRPFGIALKP